MLISEFEKLINYSENIVDNPSESRESNSEFDPKLKK